MIEAYFINLFIIICIYVVLAVSLQLSLGYTGLLNLGHVAFYGIGAYVTALLSLAGIPFPICFLMSGVIAAFFGFILSIPTNKLKGDYLALTTLGFSFITYSIFLNWADVTRGPLGLPGIPRPLIFGFNFTDNFNFLLLTFFVALISYLIIYRIIQSPFGKVLQATRDDELATKTLGKNTFKMKSVSLIIAAFFAGIAGSLFAYYINYIDPTSFVFLGILPMLLIVIVGGVGSLFGTILAAIFVLLLPEPLRFINFPPSLVGPARQILFSAILLAVLIFKPKGFYGKLDLE